MTSDLARRVAAIVADVDTAQLASIVEAVRIGANDGRTARRVVERRAPVALRSELTELFTDDDLQTALAALEAAVAAVQAVRVELGVTEVVWTGPPTKSLQVRPTRAVVLELIRRARESITIVTFASHDIADLVGALDEARLDRGVTVRVIVETREDTPRGDGPEAADALKHLPLAVPVYRWPREQRGPTGASMHVKCVIRDRTEVLVSSANLTSAALDRNMELGLVVDGGATTRVIEQHYDDLIEGGSLVLVRPA
jgi:phosphatidylserine/phosphatidylglycerophosphate/cardiolipin synthase-like enzyme